MQMHVHKDSFSSTILKRKAEDHEQDHKTKKAKPTSGYVPGTGKPYKGTARIEPNSPPSRHVRALGYKSTNAPLKIWEKLSKQDTKNLNRNASKIKMPSTVGSSVPSVTLPTDTDVEGHEPNKPKLPKSDGARSRERG